MPMKRERELDSFDSEEQEEIEASDGREIPSFGECGEALPFRPPRYHGEAATGLSSFQSHSQSDPNSSALVNFFPSFPASTEMRDSGPWRADQSINAQSASGFAQVALTTAGAGQQSQRAARQIDPTQTILYERTLQSNLAPDYQTFQLPISTAAQDDGSSSLNRLIDHLIQTAEKVTAGQHRRQAHSNLPGSQIQPMLYEALPEATGRPLPGLLPAPDHLAHLSGSAESSHFPAVHAANIIHQPPPASLFGFSSHPIQSSSLAPAMPTTTAPPCYGLPNRRLNSQVTSSSASSNESIYSPRNLYLPQDEDNLSRYQCLLRQQLEFFAADWEDVAVIQGRNKPVVRRQVGIRCIHCAHLPIKSRDKGSSYFSARLDALYQSAQNLAKKHLLQKCRHIPPGVREQLSQLKQGVPRSSTRSGGMNLQSVGYGKGYWAEAARNVGVFEDETHERLEFRF